MKEKNNLYIHLGMAKTGTTALQTVLSGNEKLLKKNGFIYPTEKKTLVDMANLTTFDKEVVLNNINCARLINIFFDVYKKHGDKGRQDVFPLPVRHVVDYVDDELLKSNTDDATEEWNSFLEDTDKLLAKYSVIYSNELVWPLPDFFVKEMYERYGDRLKFIVYLRRQDRYIESIWAQLVSGNLSNLSFDKFVMITEYMEGYPQMLDYRARLEYMASVVGEKNMYVRAYKKTDKDGKRFNIIKDFFEILGIEDEPVSSKKQVNSHISGNAIEYLRIYNTTLNLLQLRDRVTNIKYEKLIEYLGYSMKKGGKDLYFKPGMRTEFMRRFEDGNRYVSDKFLCGEALDPEGVLPDDLPTIRELSESEIETIKFITALLVSEDDTRREK